jgi:hypothetical protein
MVMVASDPFPCLVVIRDAAMTSRQSAIRNTGGYVDAGRRSCAAGRYSRSLASTSATTAAHAVHHPAPLAAFVFPVIKAFGTL